MSLEKKYNDLNQMAKEVDDTLYKIFVEYLEGDNPFPYGTVEKLVGRYELFHNKLHKKKYSVVNDFLCIISSKRKDMIASLDAPNGYEVLNLASERVIPLLVENGSKYIPIDEKSKSEISDKLFPIVKNLKSFQISTIYKSLKENVINSGVSLDDNSFALLQQMFAGYIIDVLSHNPYNKYSRVRNLFTYEEVCKIILNESVLEIKDKDNSKNR